MHVPRGNAHACLSISTSREKTTATDDVKTVQTSLFSLVKDFFCRSFSGEEMQSLLSYVAGAQDEQQVRHPATLSPNASVCHGLAWHFAAGGEKLLRSWWGTWRVVDNRPHVLQVCGALEVIHSLLKGSPAQEQLFAFLFEPGHVEVLFSLLVQKKFSDEVRERVFKVRRVPSANLLLSLAAGGFAAVGWPPLSVSPGPLQDAEVREGP